MLKIAKLKVVKKYKLAVPNYIRLSFYVFPIGDQSIKTELTNRDVEIIKNIDVYNSKGLVDMLEYVEEGDLYSLMVEGAIEGRATGADLGIYNYTKPSNYVYEDNVTYTSNYPVAIKYTLDGKVTKYFETFKFSSICGLDCHKPIFDINSLKFTYSYNEMDIMIPNYEECYLLIDDVYDNSDFESVNEMKKIPLSLVNENGIVSFRLIDKYYYDSSDGMVYKSIGSGRKEINNLILPTTYKGNTSVYYELHFKEFSASKSNLVFKSYANFDVKWFGSCSDSYFCVDYIEELLEDVYYSGGVTI